MRLKTFFKMMGLTLALVLSVVPVRVTAADNIHSPGPLTYELDRGYFLSADGAALSGDDLVFEAGGSMKFDLLLPFDSDELVVSYQAAADCGISIATDEGSYTASLSASAQEQSVVIEEFYGSNTFTITADGAVTITSLEFQKIYESFHAFNGVATELSDYEYALLSATVFKNDATIVKSKGAIRRLDYDNLNMTPKNVDGSLYVPLKVLAAELGFYCEDYPDKSYVLLRGEGIDLEMVAGKGTFNDDLKGGYEVEMNIFYEDGITWAPLRKLSETMKFYVEYRDGYAVIDDRLSARKVVEDAKIFSTLCEEFAPYIGTVTAGTTYHVSVDHARASDANSGTEAYPFKTLQKAGQVAQAGDTVIIHEGTYREVLAPQNNGTPMAPITFRAAEGENVVISALEPLGGFIEYKDNIYCASVPVDLGEGRNQLFYQGEALTEGRHPNTHTKVEAGETHGYPTELPDIWPTQGKISVKVDNINETRREGYDVATSDTDLNQSAGYWQGGTFVAFKGEAWTMVSGDIVDSGEGWLKLKEHDGSKSFNLGINGRYYRFVHKPDYGYITNHINTVDLPGEWYMGDGIMYVYPPEGADLGTDFEIKQRQLTVDLRDRKFINLKGINTVGGGVTISGDLAEGNVLDGGEYRWISHFTKLIDAGNNFIDPNESNTQRDNSITRGEVGVAISGKNNAVINSTIEFSAGAGVHLTGLNHYVYNNVIGNTSYGGGYPGAVNIARMRYEEALGSYGGHAVRHNTLYNGGRALVNMASVAITDSKEAYAEGTYAPFVANELAYNRIYQGSITARDSGVTYQYGYTGGNDKRRTQIHHNYVYDNMVWDRTYDPYDAATNPGGIGTGNTHIYQDGYTANQDTYYNLTFQSLDIGMGGGGTYEQAQPWTQVRQRSNSDLGNLPAGLDGLTNESFPGGKPYYAGSFHDGRERFMMNYNNLEAGIKAYLPDTSDTVESSWDFQDVNVTSEGYTLLSVDYVRDVETTEIIDVSAAMTNQAGEVVSQVTMPISTAPNSRDESKLLKASIVVPNEEAGVYDVNITFEDEHSTALRLRTEAGNPNMRLIFDPEVIYAGDYDEWIEGTSTGEILPARRGLSVTEAALEQGRYHYVGDTWMHTFVYQDREIEEDADTLDILLGTGTPYHGQSIEIYADSMEGEPIATVIAEDTMWKGAVQTVPLAYTLPAGTHTFYVKCGVVNKCSTIYYYDFYNSATRVNEDEVIE